jgi:hypothetical protein
MGQEMVVFKIKYRKDMTLIPQDEEFEKLIWVSVKDLPKYDFEHRLSAYEKALKLCGLK